MGAADLLLTFDEATHTYRVGGSVVPGVTSVLKPFVDFSGINPSVLAAKADLGRRVHLATQLDDEDDLDESSIEPDVAPYLQAYRRFRADTRAVIVAREERVYDPIHRFAGTLDGVFTIKAENWLVDLKTCFVVPVTAGPQTAAYLRALNDPSVTRRGALRLRQDGTYRLDPLRDPDDWSAFLACLTIHRYTEKAQ